MFVCLITASLALGKAGWGEAVSGFRTWRSQFADCVRSSPSQKRCGWAYPHHLHGRVRSLPRETTTTHWGLRTTDTYPVTVPQTGRYQLGPFFPPKSLGKGPSLPLPSSAGSECPLAQATSPTSCLHLHGLLPRVGRVLNLGTPTVLISSSLNSFSRVRRQEDFQFSCFEDLLRTQPS